MGFRMIGHRSRPVWEDPAPVTAVTAQLAYIALADRDYRAQWVMDALPCYEIVLVRAGALRLWLEDECLHAGPGDVLTIPPRVMHREETPAGSISEAIYMGATVRQTQSRSHLFPLPLKLLVHVGLGSLVEQRMAQIMTEMQARAPGYTSLVSGAVLEVFWHLARLSADIATPAGHTCEPLSFAAFARDAREYLMAHHAEPLSIDDIARHFGLSRQYFTRLFRRVTGCPPHAFLTRVRLQRAKDILAATDLPVHSVATAVGFADPYYFSRCFRQHTGQTPTQYRSSLPRPPGRET